MELAVLTIGHLASALDLSLPSFRLGFWGD